MVQTIHSFQRSVRLPVTNIEASLPLRQELDAKVQQAAAGLGAQDSALECADDDRRRRWTCGSLTTIAYEIVITSRCGQDRVIRQGEKLSFISYTWSPAAISSRLTGPRLWLGNSPPFSAWRVQFFLASFVLGD